MIFKKRRRKYVYKLLPHIFKMAIRTITRKLFVYLKFFGRRKSVLLVPPVILSVVVLSPMLWWFAAESSLALLPPPRPGQSLQHLRRNRSLQHYMNAIKVLIEPSSSPCKNRQNVPLLVMVSSTWSRSRQRQAVRDTWAKYQPTYFVLGLQDDAEKQLVGNRIEAKLNNDLIVFDFRDHYQNLTLKTALMMKWTLDRCPQTKFMFKTDDDVLVNPWRLSKVLWHNANAHLIGYRQNKTYVYRFNYQKWYIPRWLLHEDSVYDFLAGPGYVINGGYIKIILENAYQVPMINLEDLYYTNLVAYKKLGLTLTHDKRLSPFQPWLKLGCVYWALASVHGLTPKEMVIAWSKIENLVNGHAQINGVCKFFHTHFSDYINLFLRY